jgi:mannose-6-phosphate isomerase-like protein (cupin superfamily)
VELRRERHLARSGGFVAPSTKRCATQSFIEFDHLRGILGVNKELPRAPSTASRRIPDGNHEGADLLRVHGQNSHKDHRPENKVPNMRHVIPVDFSKFPRGWPSEVLASPKTSLDSCYVICSRAEPGAGGPKLHTHPADQFYFIISGTMRVQLGTDEFSLGPDTLVFIPEGKPHCNWNSGEETEIHLEVIAPAPPFDSLVAPAAPRAIPNAASLIRKVDRQAFTRDSLPSSFLANRASDSRHVAINVAEVQPGAGGPSFHIHSFDQCYVLDGSMSVECWLEQL